MSREQITLIGQSAAVFLPQEILEQMGVSIGDEVDLAVIDHTLILRSLSEVEREQKLEAVKKDIVERRRNAYERLAKGPEA
jgi:antitoxin component of MazEF toxin-antitoxin module